ncbi:MAG TPA: hypothetical protein VLE97_03215 [Gaiellaceae bacterium]|nr:hypothetical protein [Gaiellaceae bacterium]
MSDLGKRLYNQTWELFGGDPDELLHTAHASAYHWMQVGTAANRARSEWLCARVYSELGRAEPALHHARRCLELVESDPAAMEDWDLAAAYEALARAHAVAGDAAESARYRDLGLQAVAQVADAEDGEHIAADLRGIQVPSANVVRTDRPG